MDTDFLKPAACYGTKCYIFEGSKLLRKFFFIIYIKQKVVQNFCI